MKTHKVQMSKVSISYLTKQTATWINNWEIQCLLALIQHGLYGSTSCYISEWPKQREITNFNPTSPTTLNQFQWDWCNIYHSDVMLVQATMQVQAGNHSAWPTETLSPQKCNNRCVASILPDAAWTTDVRCLICSRSSSTIVLAKIWHAFATDKSCCQ